MTNKLSDEARSNLKYNSAGWAKTILDLDDALRESEKELAGWKQDFEVTANKVDHYVREVCQLEAALESSQAREALLLGVMKSIRDDVGDPPETTAYALAVRETARQALSTASPRAEAIMAIVRYARMQVKIRPDESGEALKSAVANLDALQTEQDSEGK